MHILESGKHKQCWYLYAK